MTVAWATVAGSATADADFTTASGVLTFAEGERTKQISVSVTADSVEEDTETFHVDLRSPTSAVLGGVRASLRILDDDGGTVRIAVSASTNPHAEDVGAATFDVSLVDAAGAVTASERTVEVVFGTADGADDGATSSAVATEDYVGTAGVLTFAPGETAKSVSVAIIDDLVHEGNERFDFLLRGAQNVVLPENMQSHGVVIQDNDEQSGRLALTVAPQSIGEDQGAVELTVTGTLDGSASTAAIEVPLSLVAGSATSGSDFTAPESLPTLVVPARSRSGKVTFNVSMLDDDVAEGDETFEIEGNGTGLAVQLDEETTVTIDDDDELGVAIEPTELGLAEGASGGYTVALTSKPSADVTVTPALTGDSDLGVSAALTFTSTNWAAPQTITVSAAHDADAEDDIGTVEHTVAGGDYDSVEAPDVAVTVDDDEVPSTTVSLSVSQGMIDEGAVATVVTVTGQLDGGARGSDTLVVVSVGGGAGGAIEGEDFEAVNDFELTIPGGSLSAMATFNLAPSNDALDESDETLEVSGATETGLAVSGATITIIDDDTRGVTVAPSSLAIDEGDAGAYTVSLASQPTARVEVLVDVPAGSDLRGSPLLLVFEPADWSTALTVDVRAVADEDRDNDGPAAFRHTVTGGDYEGAPAASVDVTINDTTPLQVAIRNAIPVRESSGTAEFVVELSHASQTSVQASYETTNVGTATAGDDFVETNGLLTFDAGTLRQVIEVPILDDRKVEDDETVDVVLKDPVNAELGNARATIVLQDDDVRGVLVSSTELRIAEGGSGMSYQVSLLSEPSAPVTIGLAVVGDADVMADASSLTFTTEDWSSEQTVTVTAASDTDVLNDRARIEHSPSGGDYDAVTASSVEVAVTDDDEPAPAFSFAMAAPVHGDTDSSGAVDLGDGLTYTATVTNTGNVALTDVRIVDLLLNRDPPTTCASVALGDTCVLTGVYTVRQRDVDAGTVRNTATASARGLGDQRASQDTAVAQERSLGLRLEIVPATYSAADDELVYRYTVENSGTVTLAGPVVVSDDLVETIACGAVAGAGLAPGDSVGCSGVYGVTQEDVDAEEVVNAATASMSNVQSAEVAGRATWTPPAAGDPSLSVAAASASEVSRFLGFSVTLGAESSQTVMVEFSTSDETDDAAEAGIDYTAVSGTLIFPPGTTERLVNVPITDDRIAESDETFTLNVSAAVHASLTAASVKGTIQDDETAGVTVSPTSLTIAEGASDTYTVVLDSQPTADVMVTLSVPGAGGFTADPSVLTFSSTTWSTAQTVTVSATEDADAVAPAPATIGHSAAGGGYDAVTVEGVRVTVTENDAAGVTVRPTSLTIAEGASDAYTVLLDSQPPADVMVTLSVPGAGGFTADPSVLTFSSTTWSAAQTVTVSATEDADAVAPAPATIGHSAAGGGYDAVTVEGVRVTVTENDAAGVTVTPTSLTIAEGASDTYTVVLTTQPTADVMVTLSVPGSSGFTADPAVLTFSSTTWSTAQTVTVSATEDADAVAPAPATIGHSAAGGGYDAVTVEGVRVTVTENDAAGVTVRPTSLTIAEGASDAYTVLLDSQPPADVMVTLSVPGAGGFTADPSVLTFSSTTWSAAQTVTVSATEDADAVAPAPATIGHSAAGGGYDAVTVEGVRVTVTENDAAGVTVRPTSLTIAEGASDAYTVLLDSQPTADVMVTLSVPGAGGFTADPSVLTFSSTTWSAAQTVTVSATEDADAVAPAPATIGHSAAGGGYDAVTVEGVRVTVTENDAAGVTVTPTSLTIAEGASDTYTVVLTTQPTADVMVTLSVPGAGGFTADPSVLTFSSTTWSAAQTVTVSATEDADAVAPAPATIGHSAAGGGYDAVTVEGVRVTVTENDAAGVTVTPTSLTIAEGASDAYTVVLTTPPPADVMVTLSVPGAGGFTADPSVLTFSSTTWSAAQTVTVSATEDADAVAPAPATIGHRAAGGGYDAVTVEGVRVTVTENDAAGVTVTPTSLTIAEGASDTYTVVLTTPPPADVMVTLSVPGAGGFTADPSVLTFSSTTWSAAQTVTVSATEDADAVAPAPATIGHSAAGGGYDAVTVEGVRVTVTENDAAGVTVTPTSLTIAEGASDTYTVVLTTQPTADVMVTLSVPGAGGFTADPSVLTFSSTTWSAAQTVTVSATEDADAVAPAPATIGHSAAGGGYDAVTVEGVRVTVTENDAAGVTVTPTSLTIAEGASDTYTVLLDSQPPADVMVTLSVPGAGGFTADPSVLTFSSTTWSAAQTVTVSATEDADAVAPAPATIGHGAAGGGYGSVTVDGVFVTVTENDAAGVTVSPTSLTIMEGASDAYTVVLTTQPPADVMVTLSVPGAGGFTADPSVLTFSSTTWSTAQTVTVSATEDADAVAPAPATIGHSAAGGGYDAVTVEGVRVTVTENDAAGVTVRPTSLTIAEDASDAYTVLLDSQPTADVMVTLSVPGSSGFTADPSVLTFSSTTWSTAQTVTVSATEDADAVAPAPATIGHSAAGGGYDAVTVDGVLVTVTDNDAAGVTVTPTSLTITEGASDTYTVVLTTQPPADVMVTLSVPGAGGFTADPSVLTFSSTTWSTAQTVTVSATEDADAVAPAPATIGHSAAGGGYGVVTVDGVLVTVTEDDTAGVTVTPTSLTITEGASDTYTVVLTTPPTADVMVTLSVPGSSGFTADPAVLTFSSTTWSTAQTVTVSATEDADAVAPAPATIGHSAAGGGYDAVTVEGVLVTVTEDDAAGVTVTPTSLTIMEGASDTYTVVLTTQPPADVMVTLSVPGAGGFTADPSVLTFSSTTWDTAQTVTVSATEDADAVAPAPATIGHSAAGGGYGVVTVDGVLVTVTENDAPGVTVSPASLTITEGASDTYTVVLTTPPTADVMVTLSVPGAGGFTADPSVLTFSSTTWSTAQTVTVSATEDADAVAPAPATIGHGAAGGGYDAVTVEGVLVTVTEDDTAGVTVTPTSLTITEGASDTYTVVLTTPPTADVMVTLSVPGAGGFTADPSVLTFSSTTWDTAQTVTVSATEDADAVAPAPATIGHSAAGGGYGVVTVDGVLVTVTENDAAGVTVTPTSLTITEGASDTYTVVLTTPPTANVMVTLSVPGAGGFTADPSVLTFSSTTWSAAQTVTMSATEDADAVAPAPATIGHSAAGGGYDAVTVEGVVVTVTEDDAAGVTVSPTSLTITEGASDTYTVVLTTPPPADVMVTLSVPGAGGFTADPSVLTFSSTTWSAAQTVTVSATEDADAVAPAPATIGHSAAGGGYDAVTVEGVLVTVTDNDAAGVTVTPTSLTITEGASDTYTVVLDSQPTADVMVTLSVPGAGGFTADPSVLTFSSTTWSTAQTVTVSATEDADAVAPAPATIGHSAAGGGYDAVTVEGVVVTVTEDDTAGVTVTPTSLTITEGASDAYTVVLTTPPTADVMVTLSVPGAGGFTADPSVLTFSSTTWDTAQTVTVSATEDADAVAPAPATIGHSAAGGGYGVVTVDGVLVTVTENDAAGVTVTPTSLTITEGASDTYTVVLTTPPTADVMVTLSVPGAGGFTADPSVLTFSSTTWSTAQTVTVSATEDADAVAPAPATIGHSAAGGGYDAVTVEGVLVTVTENDAPGVTVTPTSLTITEGASDTYTVVLTTPPPANVMVTLSVPGAGGFTADPSVLTFSSTTWDTAQTVTVSATEDADAVAPAPATIGHGAAGGGYDAVAVEGVVVTVTEDDTAGVTVTPTSLTIAEGASDAYTVLLDSQPTADVMVTLSVPGAGGFTADPSVLTFSSTTWSAAQTVTVSATEDADAVAPAPATIGHSAAGGGYDAVTVEGVLVTVTEDDAAGVTVTPTSLTIAEGASDTYTVVLTTQPPVDVMVTLSVPGSSGFTADPAVLTFSSTTWDTAQTVTVSATEDADAVAPAPATIGHSAAGGGYGVVTVDGVLVTVTENDAPGVTVSPASLTITEGASDTYTVVLTTQPTADVMVTLSVPGAGGFTADPSVLTFSSTTWSTAQTVTVSATEDADAVAPAPATIGHSAAGGGYDAVTVEGVLVTVTDNDAAGVTVSPTSLTITEGASDTYTVVLDSQPTADVMVTLSVPGSSGFTADPSVLTFSSTTWSAAQTVTVSATEDADAVAPAPATIGHSAAGGGYDAVTVEGVVVTVTEDDTAGVTVTPTSLTITEGASDAYTVVLTTPPTADVMVTLSVPGAGGFTADPSVLTFSSTTWDTAQTVTVSATEDADAVAPAPATIGHSAAGGGYDAVTVEGVVVTVTEDDTAGVTVTPTSLTITEGASDAYTVVLTTPPTADVMVTLSVPGAGGFTADPSVLTFSSTTWSTAQTVTVSATEDADAVAPAPATIGHSAAGGGYDAVTVEGVLVTVTENDAPGVTVSPASLTIMEGASDTYTVVLTTPPTADVMVTLSVPGSSGFTADPSVLTFSSTTWSTVQTVTVSATEDADAVAPAPATIGHSAAGGGYDAVTVEGVVVTVTEDDVPVQTDTVTLSATPTEVGEGAVATPVLVTVTLQGAVRSTATPVRIGVGLSGDGATEGVDYATVDEFTITIAAEAASNTGTFTLTPTQDTLDEADETLSVTGTTSVAGLSVTPAEVTIEDDDAGLPSVAFASNAYVVEEGKAVVVGVLLSRQRQTETVVLLTVDSALDGGGVDYTGVPAMVAFAPGQTLAEFAFRAEPDDVSDSGEVVVLALGDLPPDLDRGYPDMTRIEIVEHSTLAVALPSPPALPELTIAPGPSPVTEGSEVEFTVTRSHALTELPAVEVLVSETGSVLGPDPPAEVRFSPGELAAVLSLATVDDNLDEPTSVVRAALSAGDGYALGGETTATVRVADNDAEPELTIEPLIVGEGERVAEFVARLSAGSARPLTVDWSTSDGEAFAGSDYRVTSGVMTFAAGEREARLKVELIDDDVAEPSEEFTIVLRDAQMIAEQRSTKATIIDDDAAPTAITLALDRERVSEGAGATTVTVTASLIRGVWDRATLVEVAVAGGGDEEAVDFSPVSGFEILIPATESSAAASFTLIPEDDRIDERNEAVEVSGTSTLPVTAASLILEDDDASSRSIRLTVDRERVSEGAGPAVITVTATLDRSARTEDTPVQIVLSDSGLAEAVDYSAVREFGLTIPTGQLSGSVQFTLIPEDDRIDERDETIEVAGSSVLPVSPALVLLEDDDGASQAIVLSLDQEVILENAGPTLVTVTAALDRSARTEDTPVRIEVRGSGTPGAVRFAPVDSFDLTIGAGELSGAGTFTMTPLISILKSSPETVGVRGASDLPVVPAALLLVDVDTGEVPAGWLERFARTVASQTVDLVRERLDGMVGGGNQLTLFGYRLFGGYGGQLGGLYGGPAFSGYGLSGSAGPAGQVRAGPLPVGAASAGGGWLGGQGPFGYSGHGGGVSLMGGQIGGGSLGGAVALSSSLGQLATWGDRAPAFSLSRYPSDQRRDLLARSSFTFSSAGGSGDGAEDAGNWMVWGRGAKTNFRGREANASLIGDVVTGTVGVDYERGDVLAGVAIARTSGQGRMEATGAVADVDASLTSGLPYLRVKVGDRLTLWGILGYGQGRYRVTEHDFVTETDIGVAMAAAGARRDLASWASGLRLRLNSDAFLTRVQSEAVPGLDAVDADVNRLRFALEGSYARSFASGSVLTPSVELGVRYDGGAADTGYGVELGAGLRYANIDRGLTAEVAARSLLTHEASDFEEWGASGSMALDPGQSGLGPAFRIRSSWGAASGGVQQLWSQEQMFEHPTRSSFQQGGRMEAEAGYGFGRRLGRNRLMPYGVLMGTQQGERGFGMGARLNLGAAFNLTLEASRRERSGPATVDASTSDDAVVIRGVWRLPPRRQPLPGFADDPATASFSPCPVEEQVSEAWAPATDLPADGGAALPDSSGPGADCADGR